jgi:hypothetical chaperone protein
MTTGFGLDFGTTNSAIACSSEAGEVRLARFGADAQPTFRSVLFFGRDEEDGPVRTAAGPRAIESYLACEHERRLVQSLKSFLASRLFKSTNVMGRTCSLEDLIGLLIGPLRDGAAAQLGDVAPPIVVGRPVHFAKANGESDDRRAVTRLEAALWEAGLPDPIFEYEPVAAAHHYEQGLDHEELVLIADFGGGTSDFCLLPVGPSFRGRAREPGDIIGTSGVAIAGDAFDAKIVRHVVAERLGKGSLHQVFLGQAVPLPNWIYRDLERWHHLSFLKNKRTMAFLYEALEGAREPEKIEALIHVVELDLGHALYRSVEAAKSALSVAEETTFAFHDDPVHIETRVRRADFEAWIADELEAIETCLDALLEDTGTRLDRVDRVFMTGGSSFVPAVRRLFTKRFGDENVRGGEELVSVASGLALRARDLSRARGR